MKCSAIRLAILVAAGATAAGSASVAGAADYGTTGLCKAAQAGFGGTYGIPSLPARIILTGTTVSVINESPYTQDSQKVVRTFYLYQWMGGSSWAYTGIANQDETRVSEPSFGSNLLNPTSSAWWDANGWDPTPFLPLPDSGLVFQDGYPVYRAGLWVRWYSMRTGQLVAQWWNPAVSNLLGYDLYGNYENRPYCDFRAAQPN